MLGGGAISITRLFNMHSQRLSDCRTILLVDDHAIYRQGLRLLLFQANPVVRVAEADSIEKAVAIAEMEMDLALVDIRLPGLSGLDGISILKARWPAITIVILSALEGGEILTEAQTNGAAGFISKAESTERILQLIDNALERSAPQTTKTENGHLTPRQREVISLLCNGLSNKLIARHLSLSENTVRRHVQDILEYFQVDSRSKAVFVARRRGLVE